MENMPKLVVLTGYPSSGKTTVSKFLSEELGYARVGVDDVVDGARMDQDEVEFMLWPMVTGSRNNWLSQGKNVVVDSPAASRELREYLFETCVPCQKYLVWMRTSPGENYSRKSQQVWTRNDIEKWKAGGWEDPQPGSYTLLVYPNDTQEDLGKIKEDLIRRLS